MQHGCLHHASPFVVVEHGEELVGQVVGYQSVVTPEGLDEPPGVVGSCEGQAGEQLGPRSPTLRACTQVVEALVVESVGAGSEQSGSLGVVEAEVARTDLADPAAHVHPTQPERRVGAL